MPEEHEGLERNQGVGPIRGIMYYNVWVAISEVARAQYHAKRSERGSYAGPMTNRAFNILSAVHGLANIEVLFKSPSISGKQYFLISLYVDSEDAAVAQDAITYMEQEYPNDFIKLGVWKKDGTRAGDIHPQAWRLMPDLIEYDSLGNVINIKPSNSNADLRDISLLYGQEPRDFS